MFQANFYRVTDDVPVQHYWAFKIADVIVCEQFFFKFLYLNESFFYELKKRVHRGEDAHRRYESCTRDRDSELSDTIEAWLVDHAKQVSDQMPDGQYKLPYRHKRHVWEEYLLENVGVLVSELPGPAEEGVMAAGDHKNSYSCSEGYFERVWKKRCPLIKLARDKGTHSICDDCLNYTIALKNRLISEADRNEIKARKRKHLAKQRRQRAKYAKHKEKARQNPDKYLSIIFDGFDGRKSMLPFSRGAAKSVDECKRYEMSVIAVQVHGVGIYYYFFDALVEGGSNPTIECLRRTLIKVQEKLGTLPRVCYLQADNCIKDNKNKNMLAFLSHLLQTGVFDKIKYSFLMKGKHQPIGGTIQYIYI